MSLKNEEPKYLLMNLAKKNLISEAISNCLNLFGKDSNKLTIIDSVGIYMNDAIDKGRNFKIPAISDNVLVNSMEGQFVIPYDKNQIELICLVLFMLRVADKVYRSENYDKKLNKVMKGYEVA
jgi:hypothetical protein